jgi:hypothetical protein
MAKNKHAEFFKELADLLAKYNVQTLLPVLNSHSDIFIKFRGTPQSYQFSCDDHYSCCNPKCRDIVLEVDELTKKTAVFKSQV